jgi:2-(1,2-epoxy-1,2-dihydrophenyl)acetyl-CoA isomerase
MAAIEHTVRGAITEILLNRPVKKNALRDEHFVELTALARQVAESSTRCVVVSGAGGAFCAGRDISDTNVAETDAATLIRKQINPLFIALRGIPVPTIAVVEGACVGGGFGIAFACDIVLAADDARIGSPFGNIGILPDSGIHHHLCSLLGYHRACELLFTGRLLSGTEASACGLINRAYAPADLHRAARDMARQIADGPTMAFKKSKIILQRDGTLGDVLDVEATAQGDVFRTADAAEGFTAFQQKRKPQFTGR